MSFLNQLRTAFEKRGFQKDLAYRIFHGPGEGEGVFQQISVDKFADHAWVSCEVESLAAVVISELANSLQEIGFKSAAIIFRKKKGAETQPSETLFGNPPENLSVTNCGLKFLVNLKSQRQPGLFLDLNFVRNWLLKNSDGKTVLNLFSFTGSLSVAAGVGRASHVTSIDLSKNFTEWAKRNWELNQVETIRSDFLFGDSFDWLKRFKKQERTFDIVVCDPPSFSRTKTANFSTLKDSKALHERIFDILAPRGTIVTSINTEKITKSEFIGFIKEAAEASGRTISVESEFGLPSEFPVRETRDAYLKGVVIKTK